VAASANVVSGLFSVKIMLRISQRFLGTLVSLRCSRTALLGLNLLSRELLMHSGTSTF
jgi:hypothetical protein